MSSTLSFGQPSSLTVTEGNAGSARMSFTVLRQGNSAGTAEVSWSVVPGSTGLSDYLGGALPSGLLSFAAGETSKIIAVDIAGDTLLEGNETFNVTLFAPVGASFAFSQTTLSASGTIANDDGAILSLSPTTAMGYEATLQPRCRAVGWHLARGCGQAPIRVNPP